MNSIARSIFAGMSWALLLMAGAGCNPAQSASRPGATVGPIYVIGLSPFLEDDCKDDVYRRIAQLLLETLPLDSSLRIYDAYRLRTIARADIPRLAAFRSAKTRANQFKKEIHALKQFLAARNTPLESPNLDLTCAVRFPQFLKFVGDNIVGRQAAVSVLVLGSPLYLDPKEPGFSMARGYYPSDGHLSASEEQSVFGVKNRPEALRDVRVCAGFFGDPWVSDIHKEKVARFWRLFVEQQGGRLGTFCGDLATLFSAFAETTPAMGSASRERFDLVPGKIEMLRISRRVELTDWITNENPAHLRAYPPSRDVGPLKIGIRWKGDIDLDLYGRPRPGATQLSFQRATSPEGYYFKDHRSSPLQEYEYIEFETPVNVRELEASVNFYGGNDPGRPAGEVRVEFDGGVYAGRFSLRAQQGNQGRTGSGQGDYWTEIDVPRILLLRD